MPVYYWLKIIDTGNYQYMFKANVLGSKLANESLLNLLHKELLNQFVEHFRFSNNYLEIYKRQIELIKLINQRIQTGDRSIETFIDRVTAEIEKLQKSNQENTDSFKSHPLLEKAWGMRINTMETSVSDYYNYIRNLKAQNHG